MYTSSKNSVPSSGARIPPASKLPPLPTFQAAAASDVERMHWIQVPFTAVEALYDRETLKVQRNHVRRLQHADHLTNGTALPLHMNYLAARMPDESLQLLDGYTRITAIREGRAARPDTVWLGIVDVDSSKQAEQIYLAVDSRKAVKTGRDAFEEGLRKAGLLDKLVSPIFINGYAVSALAAAAGSKETLKEVVRFKKAIKLLDPLQLDVGRFAMPAGALAACLLLALHEEDTTSVQRFAAAIAHPERLEPEERKLVPGAVKFAAWLQARREEGALSGRNVPVIMQQALGAFRWQSHGAQGKLEPITREEYLQGES
jgi:hypothetical protein